MLSPRKDPRFASHALADKLTFYSCCRDAEIPTPAVLLAITEGVVSYFNGTRRTIPRGDLLVKSMHTAKSCEVRLWQADEEDWTSDRQSLCADELIQSLIDRSMSGALIVQRAVEAHPALRGLGTGALPTVRAITTRKPRGRPKLVDAALRLPMKIGKAGEDLRQIDLGVPIDLVTGILGGASDPTEGLDSNVHTHHPISGVPIRGCPLPFWTETIALAERAHARFSGHAVIGWDIAILSSGPSVIDGNSFPGVEVDYPPGRKRPGTTGSSTFTALQTFLQRRGDNRL